MLCVAVGLGSGLGSLLRFQSAFVMKPNAKYSALFFPVVNDCRLDFSRFGAGISRRRKSAQMTNPFNRGSAPDRARDDLQRPGDFERGHKKLGGRKKGTPNRISPSHKRAMREAIHRIGYDGYGKDGEVGYFKWVAERDLTFFYVDVWSRLLEVQIYAAAMGGSSPRVTMNAPPRHALRKIKTHPSGWWLRGDDDAYESLVQDYMGMAVGQYKTFCKFYVAAFLTPPKNWRSRVARSQRHFNELCSPAIASSKEDQRDQELKFARFCALLKAKGGSVTP
jgi:hypothetical protein